MGGCPPPLRYRGYAYPLRPMAFATITIEGSAARKPKRVLTETELVLRDAKRGLAILTAIVLVSGYIAWGLMA